MRENICRTKRWCQISSSLESQGWYDLVEYGCKCDWVSGFDSDMRHKLIIAPVMKNRILLIIIFAKNNCATKKNSFKRKFVLRFLL
jgi:hypothetical protein